VVIVYPSHLMGLLSRAPEQGCAAEGWVLEKGETPLDAGGPSPLLGGTGATEAGHTRDAADVEERVRPGRKRRRRRGRRRAVSVPAQPSPHSGGEVLARPPQAAKPALHQPVRSAASGETYGALDLGTNNCRLLVAAPRERGFRVVDAYSRIVRLGEGIAATGRLSEAAMGRAIQALLACRGKLEARRVGRMRLIATEAVRGAANGREFIDRVRRETGLELEIVSQETEARLAVSGCASLIDSRGEGVLLFDIGGGSSELVWIDLNRHRGQRRPMADRIRAWSSLQLGVVTLSERHGGEHVDRALYEVMVAEVDAMLAAFPEAGALSRAVAGGGVHMLGTSGTITTLAGLHLDLPRYERRLVDGLWMESRDVSHTIDLLLDQDHAGRVAHPCIGRDRADLVMAGCAILEAVMRRWPCRRMRVADRGLREGMLVELMAADGVWRRGGELG
jgi:exopolyphosphatase/guanosine-5'-triphosphate,3'-diphosphate pyrophosphatase